MKGDQISGEYPLSSSDGQGGNEMNTRKNSAVYWTLINDDQWNITIAATEAGVCFIDSAILYEDLATWVKRRFPDRELIRNDEICKPYAAQMVEYLRGERTSFTIPMDMIGTSFQLDVWKALLTIPYGQTLSYSDISHHIGKPSSVRAVGAAIGKNPLLITVPCHRVIAKDGALTGYRGGLAMKEKLLTLECHARKG